MFNRINYKYFIRQLLVSAVLLCNLFSQFQIAWSQDIKPKAVVIGLNITSTPEISEQILLQSLRDKLEYNFDLGSQSEFEKSFSEKTLSNNNSVCTGLKCLLDVHEDYPSINLFLLNSSKKEKRITLAMV